MCRIVVGVVRRVVEDDVGHLVDDRRLEVGLGSAAEPHEDRPQLGICRGARPFPRSRPERAEEVVVGGVDEDVDGAVQLVAQELLGPLGATR